VCTPMPNSSSVSTSVGVRIPNGLLAEIDRLVGAGASSRTAVIVAAIEQGLAALHSAVHVATERPARRRGKSASTPSAEQIVADPGLLSAFAASVLAAARAWPADRFGADRIPIARAHKAWTQAGGQLDLAQFKACLVAANRARNLDLVCHDLVCVTRGAEREELRASQTDHLSATFHLVCL